MLRESMIVTIMKREVKRMLQRPLYMFSMILAPVFLFLFFITLMGEGLPADIPVGVVDEDNSAVTRQIIRNLDAFQ